MIIRINFIRLACFYFIEEIYFLLWFKLEKRLPFKKINQSSMNIILIQYKYIGFVDH